jgi:hypothetical protein
MIEITRAADRPRELLDQGRPWDALCAVGMVYKHDGDLMRCRSCKRGMHASRISENLAHRSDCVHEGDENPWRIIAEALATAKPSP